MIARDAFPYVAFQLEISGFSQGSIRERRSPGPASAAVAGRRALPRNAPSSRLNLIRNLRPRPDAPRVIQRMSPLRTFGIIAQRIVMRQLPQSPEARFILPLCNHLGRSSRPTQTSFQLSTRFPHHRNIRRSGKNLTRRSSVPFEGKAG